MDCNINNYLQILIPEAENSSYPVVNPCFQHTVLTWIPCAFLWFCTPFALFSFHLNRQPPLAWRPLLVSKIALSFAQVLISICLFASSVLNHETVLLMHPILLFASVVNTLALIIFCYRNGIVSSGTIFLTWLIFFLCGWPEMFWWIWQFQQKESIDLLHFACFFAWYGSVVGQLLLHSFADRKHGSYTELDNENTSPELGSSFLNTRLFSWLTPLIARGYHRHLEYSDLWKLNTEDSAPAVVARWQKNWDKAGENPSIVWMIIKLTKWELLTGGIYKFFATTLKFVYPLFLGKLLDFIQDTETPIWYGLFYAAVMFLGAVSQTICYNNWAQYSKRAGLNLTAALISAIFNKALRLSRSSKTEHSTGKIVNHITVDVERFYLVAREGHVIWACSIEIILSFVMLWHVLGVALIPGIGVMIFLFIPITWISNKSASYKTKEMTIKDKRLDFLSEILNGIRVLKFYAWEPSMEKRISEIRADEMHIHRKVWLLDAAIYAIALTTPFLVAVSSFISYLLIDSSHVLTAQKVFVSLVLFNIIRWPMLDLPDTLASAVQGVVSNARLKHYFRAEELDENAVEALDGTEIENAVVFQNSSFSWDKVSSPTLQSLNFTIPNGSLVAVVGKVGSGKSSLLSAILGEMEKESGYAAANSSIAFVPQQAWIMNLTVRDNVLFGQEMQKRFYKDVIRSCALNSDLESFPAGDNTEIGEKGINLSGGQKQRLSLARAVYQQKELYLLDDPLSAVDSAVGSEIFENIIGPNGLLKDKTRILVTHSTTYLEFMDKIIVLTDGTISEIGRYNQLLENNGAFAQFIDEFHTENTNGNTSEEAMVTERQLSTDSMLADENTASTSRLVTDEAIEVGQVGIKVYMSYVRSLGILATIAFIAGYAASNGMDAASNAWLAHWSNLAAGETNNSGDTIFYLSIYGGLGFSQVFFSAFASVFLAVGAVRSGTILHKQFVRDLMTSTIQFFDSTPQGRIMNIASNDMDNVDNTLPDAFRLVWLHVSIVSTTIIVILFTTPWFAVFIPILVLIMYWIFKYYVATSRQLRRLVSVSQSPLYAHIEQGLYGTVSIRAYKSQDRFTRQMHKLIDRSNTCSYLRYVSSHWLGLRLDCLSAVIVFFASVLAVFARDSASVSVGSVGLSLTYAINILVALEGLVSDGGTTETEIVSVERINQYQHTDKEAAWKIAMEAENWPSHGQIEYRNFSTRYRENLDLVLKKINFVVLPSEKIGVVGRTGAGKSSLTLSLFRLLEAEEGQIVIDDQDISQLGLQQLRSNLTIIPQEPVLFSGTLRQNLDPIADYDDSQLWNALSHSHLKDFISNLPMKLDHQVAEGGENLSVGQRQLLCLSRALLRGSRILILDEATASVDMETDAMIQTTIHTHFKSATIITIAHRINTILNSDRVMVLEEGQIREFDAPSKLLADTSSLFYEMAKNSGVV